MCCGLCLVVCEFVTTELVSLDGGIDAGTVLDVDGWKYQKMPLF